MPAAEALLFPSPEMAPADEPGLFAQIVFNRPLARPLTYRVPPEWADKIYVGQRVRAPLGRGNQPATGYVVDLSATPPGRATKSLRSIIDDTPLLTAELLELTK